MADSSVSVLRLVSLLKKIRGGLYRFWASFTSTLASGGTDFPSLWTEAAGCIVSPHTTSDSSDIDTAAAYLCEIGLKHDAERLSAAWVQWETLYVDVRREIDEYGEEFRRAVALCCGKLPDPNDTTAVNKQVVLARHVTLLLGLLDELVGTVDDMLPPADDPVECLVTLQQAAPLVNRQKRTLERYLKSAPLPAVQGSGGKASLWRWSELGPWLEKQFEIPMPKKFTADSTRILTDGLADDLADKVAAKLTETNTQPHATTDIPKID